MTNAHAPHRDQPGNGTALLIIDMINPFNFPSAAELKPKAARCADVIDRLRDQARATGVPIIHVNDHFGQWHSERARLVEYAITQGGEQVARMQPQPDDYFVIKPQFSGFYATNLPVLLPKLGVRRLVLTGIATDICVLFTAADAHMRDYALWVPEDAVAACDDARHAAALAIMRESLHARTDACVNAHLADWR